MTRPDTNGDLLRSRIKGEMEDSFDEELEIEIDDNRLDKILAETDDHPKGTSIDRRVYFKELFRLQGELVKMQDWIQHKKLKVIIIFEGRDAAGKGGVIKRITQRLNPRICRVVALPAQASASVHNGTSSVMWRIFLPEAKWCCSIARGTIAQASNA